MDKITDLFSEFEKLDSYWESRAQHEFSLKIYQIMKEDNLNQAQVSKLLGVSAPYISSLLSGDRNLSLKTMVKYARKLNRILSVELLKEKSEDLSSFDFLGESDPHYAKLQDDGFLASLKTNRMNAANDQEFSTQFVSTSNGKYSIAG
ncbi:helix-turn-helix domain-containing protein [Advenella mimigardefordensis]|uniref:Putative transcriptional regulator, Xre family n=1 Tax=Advenella mimigardefordensis (strain DSM 17166 / LMG 22922 / DPN7) TaxID=1247726 RepID=W0PCK1_ADVMD|nr:helix-turn-helix transcriptional regulator [Advenella mimigardefordensis]AHG63160.1 putative transcriptional regulator, Xre family [Advenella mimigardefordensis DPN7]